MATKKTASGKEEVKVYKENPPKEVNISDYSELSYLEYAMSVTKGRAIPFIQDGLKPVHRRIVYTMQISGMTYKDVHKKSARVVGDVLGKFHPHGDSSVYEAIVRQTQDWQLRYPLVDGQGNFGSRDGDGAAAHRYTEVKLTHFNQLYMDEIRDNCVDFQPNYDGAETEPKVLPSRVPFILLNGNPGIGVAIASEIPSHNMTEVIKATIHYLENPQTTIKGIMKYIKGPDFPTKGIIISPKEQIEKVYTTGKGAICIRGRYHVEQEGKNWKLIFDELPYGVSVKKIMEEIEAIMNPEDKIKKSAPNKKISPEQERKKKLFIANIDCFKDSSNKNAPVRLVIFPKNPKQNPDELANILLAYTSLESNYNANFTMVGVDGIPLCKNLLEIISEWSEFRLTTIKRRCEYHLSRIESRLHILEGRKIILDNLDEAIRIIRYEDEPKVKLMEFFKLSDIQAEDILEMKLRFLSGLELKSLIAEITKLKASQKELKEIISSRETLIAKMIEELNEDMKKYGDKRITEIAEIEQVDVAALDEKVMAMNAEKVTVAISEKGWMKVSKGEKTLADFPFKDGDQAMYTYTLLNTDTLAVFSENGKVFNLELTTLNKELPINTLIDLGNSKISLVCPINKEKKYLLAQEQGYGFVVKGDNLFTRLKAGKEMFTVDSTMKQFFPIEIDKDANLEELYVSLISTENRLLIYRLNEISEINKGKGVALMGLNEGHSIKEIKITNEQVVNLDIKEKKKVVSVSLENDDFKHHLQKRSASAKGKFLNAAKDKTFEISFNKPEVIVEEIISGK